MHNFISQKLKLKLKYLIDDIVIDFFFRNFISMKCNLTVKFSKFTSNKKDFGGV